MKDVEYIDSKELRKIQNDRFLNTFKRLSNVPFYKEKLTQNGIDSNTILSLNDIGRLPFIVKTDLTTCYPHGTIACPMSQIEKFHFTSGTKGIPVAIGYTHKDADAAAECFCRLMKSAGVTTNSVVQNSYGYGLFTGGLGVHEAACKIGATVIPVSVGNDDRQIKLLKDFEVDTLCATPSYTMHLAHKIINEKIRNIALKRCICGAEPWSENMKRAIEATLNIEAYDVYGITEFGACVGYNCQEREGLHICEDHFFIEIIDTITGENIYDESVGELVITSINKEANPLIRYRTGDLTHFILSPCKCGRTHRRIARIIGRVDDMLIVKGINIYPSQIENFVHATEELKSNDFEIVLTTVDYIDKLTLRIEANEQVVNNRLMKQRLENEFKQRFGIKADIDFVEKLCEGEILGKKKYVRDLRKI